MKRQRYARGAGTNGLAADLYPDRRLAKAFSPDAKVGFTAIANKFRQ